MSTEQGHVFDPTEYSYRAALAASEKNPWRVEDIIGGDRRLDFDKPFLPETLAETAPLTFLNAAEKLTLNHIRGHSYLCIFGLVEEFILPFVLDHARPQLQDADDYRVRALLSFASEEAKHIHLFKCFRAEFTEDFGSGCAVIGPPREIARVVMSHHPLAVALTVLHIEWMTQRHYLESVRDDQALDPQFCSLLKHHWMEEAQHARLDTLMVQALSEVCTDAEIVTAIDEYVGIVGIFDSGFAQQVTFDLESLALATGRRFSDDEAAAFAAGQHQAYRRTFLGAGMTHRNFLATLGRLRPQGRTQVEEIARAYC